MKEKLFKIIGYCYELGELLDYVLESRTHLIQKQVDIMKCNNYSTIDLVFLVYKILELFLVFGMLT